MVYTLRFFSLYKMQFFFIVLIYLVPVLFTFYIQDVLKFNKIIPAPKGYYNNRRWASLPKSLSGDAMFCGTPSCVNTVLLNRHTEQHLWTRISLTHANSSHPLLCTVRQVTLYCRLKVSAYSLVQSHKLRTSPPCSVTHNSVAYVVTHVEMCGNTHNSE